MKRLLYILIILLSVPLTVKSQTTDDILNLLVQQNLLTPALADSIRAEAAIKNQDAEAKKKVFGVTSGRTVVLGGYTQVRYQNLDEPGKINGFDVRRARLDVKGNISPYWSYRLQTDFAGSPKLLDAYAEWKLFDYMNFTVGQAKIPFSCENLASSNKMELIDRSQVVEALVARGKDVIGNHNGRDIGVQAGGSLLKSVDRYLVDYKIGIFNGTGINASDKNEAKDVIGRLAVHPFKGLDVGGAFYSGWGNWDTIAAGRERSRFGIELNYISSQFYIRGEYIKGTDGKIKREGWYAQAGSYLIPAKLQLSGKYDNYNPNIAAVNDITVNYAMCVTYYFNNWVRIQGAYTWREEQGADINNNIGVIQLQIGF